MRASPPARWQLAVASRPYPATLHADPATAAAEVLQHAAACPSTLARPAATAGARLMVGCSCAAMSPPLSFFSSGTTTSTAPSEAASSRFSSEGAKGGVGEGRGGTERGSVDDGTAQTGQHPCARNRVAAWQCCISRGVTLTCSGSSRPAACCPDRRPRQRAHHSCTLPAGRARRASRPAGRPTGSQSPAAPWPTYVPAAEGVRERSGVRHGVGPPSPAAGCRRQAQRAAPPAGRPGGRREGARGRLLAPEVAHSALHPSPRRPGRRGEAHLGPHGLPRVHRPAAPQLARRLAL